MVAPQITQAALRADPRFMYLHTAYQPHGVGTTETRMFPQTTYNKNKENTKESVSNQAIYADTVLQSLREHLSFVG